MNLEFDLKEEFSSKTLHNIGGLSLGLKHSIIKCYFKDNLIRDHSHNKLKND